MSHLIYKAPRANRYFLVYHLRPRMKNRCHVLFVFFRKIIHEEDDTVANGDRLIQKIRALEPIDHCLFYIICLLF